MRLLLALGCVVSVLLVAVLALNVAALQDSGQASDNTSALVLEVQHLLLDGKTSSAISARKTAREVELLLSQQAFDHAQTRLQFKSQQQGTQIINEVILRIEKHIDKAIHLAAQREGQRILQALSLR